MNIEQICDQIHIKFPELTFSIIDQKSNSVLFFGDDGRARCALTQENDTLCLKTLDTAPIDDHISITRTDEPLAESAAETTAIILRKK